MMFKEKYFIYEENHFIKLMSLKSKMKFCLLLAVYLQVLSATCVSRVNHSSSELAAMELFSYLYSSRQNLMLGVWIRIV